MTAQCLGCGHAQSNHVRGHGLCLVPSCRMCLIFRDSYHKDFHPIPLEHCTFCKGSAKPADRKQEV